MKLSFLVPFRDADGTRTPAKEWIVARWRHFYPDAEILEAPDDGVDPFNKSMAVNSAAREATGDIFAILDADTWVEPRWISQALDLIVSKKRTWVIPARKSFRLTKSFSDQIMALEPSAPLPQLINRHSHVEQSAWVAGFLHILPREAFEMVGGMDERFRGWGGEDTSFTRAVDAVYGRHQQLPGVVVSLWHPRPRANARRYWLGQGTEHDEVRLALGRRYTAAAFNRTRMLEVLKR